MKTRQEMIYDFMIALAGNSFVYDMVDITVINAHDMEFEEALYSLAASLSDQYLRGVA